MEQGTINFIKEVKKQECLYNTNLPQYSQRHAVEIAWTIVATTCKMTVSECKEKWRNLRTTFTRKTKDCSGGKPYYLHDHMKFIIPYIKPLQKPLGNTEVSNSASDSVVDLNHFLDNNEPTASDTPNTNTQKRKRKTEDTEREYLNYLQNRQVSEDTNHYGPEDPRRMFLLSLMDEVGDFDQSEMRSFKRKVLQIIDDIVEARNGYYPYPVQTHHYSPDPSVMPQNNEQSDNNDNTSSTLAPGPDEPVVKIEYIEV